MDLRGIANTVTSTVNPNETVTVLRSTGYTIGAGAKQVPSYAAPVDGPGQVQALDADDIAQLDGLNIQGTIRAIYLRGALAGDLGKRNNGAQTWLVVKVLESWPDWTKAAIVLQGQ